MTDELFSLRGALVVGCLLLAAVALEAGIHLFFRTQHRDVTVEGAIGLWIMGCIMLCFMIAMVGFAWHATFYH